MDKIYNRKRKIEMFCSLKIAVICVFFSIEIVGCRAKEQFDNDESSKEIETTIIYSEANQSIIKNPDNLEIKYISDGVVLEKDGKIVFGPCKFIYDDYYNSQFLRFIDLKNGLIGYARNAHGDISILVPASYTQAYSFVECQDNYARVQKPDESWCLINKNGQTVLENFDLINRLPMVENLATGVKNGQAVLLNLDTDVFQMESMIEKILPDYKDISEPYDGFAIVTGQDGKRGVINIFHDEIIVPVQYESVEWKEVWMEELTNKKQVMFLCRKKDGTYDVVSWFH